MISGGGPHCLVSALPLIHLVTVGTEIAAPHIQQDVITVAASAAAF